MAPAGIGKMVSLASRICHKAGHEDLFAFAVCHYLRLWRALWDLYAAGEVANSRCASRKEEDQEVPPEAALDRNLCSTQLRDSTDVEPWIQAKES
eukprot:4680957-Amphidinium_carterae.1